MERFETFNPKLYKQDILSSKIETFCVAQLAFVHKFEGTDSKFKTFFKDFSLKISRKEQLLSQI